MYQVEEFPEIWADACLRDSDGRLMFLSVYGRDGSLMQLLAAIELGASQRGVDSFHLIGDGGHRHRVDVGDAKRLVKHAGKLPKQNLFGPLNQMWLYDQGLQTPDRANRIGWVLHHQSAEMRTPEQARAIHDQAWQLMNLLSPVALQDHWQEQIFTWCAAKGAMQSMESPLYPPLGSVQAIRVSLTDHFTQFVSDGVKSGLFQLA